MFVLERGDGGEAVGADGHFVPHPRQFELHQFLQRPLVVGEQERRGLGSRRLSAISWSLVDRFDESMVMLVAELLLSLRLRCRRSVTRNREPVAGAVAVGVDLAVVFVDDAIGDRQPQAGALPAAAAGEERLEQVLAALRRSCRSRCPSTTSSALAPLASTVDRHRAARLEAVEAVGDQVQHDLLHFLRADLGDDRLARREARPACSGTCPGGGPCRSRLHQLAQIGVRAAAESPMREKSSSFSVISLQRKASF